MSPPTRKGNQRDRVLHPAPIAPSPASHVLQGLDLCVLVAFVVAGAPWEHLPLAWLAARAGAVGSALLHEWCHLALGLGHLPARALLSPPNLLGHVDLRRHLRALCPWLGDSRGDLYVVADTRDAPTLLRMRVGGYWLSVGACTALCATALGFAAHTWAWPVAVATLAGALLTLTAAYVTDIHAASPYPRTGPRLACGNLTVIGRLAPGERRALPAPVVTLLHDMLHVSQLRGAQSGGGAVLTSEAGKPRQVIAKCVNPKRSSLASRMTSSFAGIGKRPAFGHTFLVHAHVRFATSGPATREESHPFRYVELPQRGLRRLHVVGEPGAPPKLQAVETAITHNGDFSAMRFRDVRIAHPDLGEFLAHVLGVDNHWQGDSPALAGAFELFLTQGMWLESLRLAYLEILAPPPPDLDAEVSEPIGSARVAAVRARLATYPRPPSALLEKLAALAEEVMLGNAGERPSAERLGSRLMEAFQKSGLLDVGTLVLRDFAMRATLLFLRNDLFRAAREIETLVEGTFGCVISSTLEPGGVVAFARGQPLSLGVQTATATVAIASERNALRIRDAGGRGVFDFRLDFDLTDAEIAHIQIPTEGPPRLTLHSVSDGCRQERAVLERSGRLVDLRDNPLTPPLPLEPPARVRQDLVDLPHILHTLRDDYDDPESRNQRSVQTLAHALLSTPHPKLLVLGITQDLWLARQFVHNLELCLPGISAEAMSSNLFLKESTVDVISPDTVVLAVSQSGQDFPTLAAMYQLRQQMAHDGHGRLFVLTGEADTLLGQVVGQSFAKRAAWLGRILTNCGGYRPSEAATASANATHAALCEVLLGVCRAARDFPVERHGLCLDEADLQALAERRDALVDEQVKSIVALDEGERVSEVARHIRARSHRYSRHVLEGIAGFALAAIVLELNIGWGAKLVPSWLFRALPAAPGTAWGDLAGWLGSQADVLYYLFLAPLFVWLIRLVQRRPALHRQGVRELLIGDTAYVRDSVWLLSRKLFSLSYGFASLKPYAADIQDDLVMTHEPLRGTLALFGIPDHRREQLHAHAAAAAMSARQFGSSRSFGGSGAEVLTLGHGGPVGAVDHLSLPAAPVTRSHRVLDLLVEGMYDSWERLMAMQSFMSQLAERVAGLSVLGYDSSRTKDQVFAPTTASPVSGAALFGEGGIVKEALRFSRVSLPFEVVARHTRSSFISFMGQRGSGAPPPPAASSDEGDDRRAG